MTTGHHQDLHEEARRQGEDYSRKVTEEFDTFLNQPFWDYQRLARARWMTAQARHWLSPAAQPWQALEVGCGIGFVTLALPDIAGAVLGTTTGLDTAATALQVGRRELEKSPAHIREKVRFEDGDFFEHTGGPYHLVFMHEVFEHIPDPDAIFAQAHQLLHPGGAFMISTPNGRRLVNRALTLAGKKPLLVDPMHVKEYTLAELTAPRPGWTVRAATGRQLLDGFSLQLLLSLGNQRVLARLEKPAAWLTHNALVHRLGALAPGLSCELMVFYQKTS